MLIMQEVVLILEVQASIVPSRAIIFIHKYTRLLISILNNWLYKLFHLIKKMHITRFKELDQKIMLDRVKMELYIYRWVSKVV